jgi:hypothetical protein
MSGTVLGLILMAALIVAEVVLSMTWNRFYFTKGIPIFWRRIESTEKLETLSLEALQKSAATAAGAPFAFRPLTPNAIAFRERPLGGTTHYMPLMRGLIRQNPEEPFISVLGLVNWSFIGLIVFLLAMLGRKVGISALYLGGALAVLYFIQAIRFGRIAKAVRSGTRPQS